MDESAAPVPLLSRQGLEETILGLISFQSLLEWPLGELGTAAWGEKGVPPAEPPAALLSPQFLAPQEHQSIWGYLESPAAPGDVKAEPWQVYSSRGKQEQRSCSSSELVLTSLLWE